MQMREGETLSTKRLQRLLELKLHVFVLRQEMVDFIIVDTMARILLCSHPTDRTQSCNFTSVFPILASCPPFDDCLLQFFSGTHAIACALYGVLRPGDEVKTHLKPA